MSKYGNQKQVVDGITFDSKREVDYYLTLKLLQKAGEVTTIETHPKFVLQLGFWKCTRCKVTWNENLKRGVCPNCRSKMPKTSAITYSADFLVTYKDGRTEIVDVKGMETEAFKIKRKLFEYKNPGLTLRTLKKGDQYGTGTSGKIHI